MAKKVALLVGTKKGGYIFRAGSGRTRWQSEGPLFKGAPVYHMTYDARDGKSMWAAIKILGRGSAGAPWDPTTPPACPAHPRTRRRMETPVPSTPAAPGSS